MSKEKVVKKNIALLAGGNSSERTIALQSAVQISMSFDVEKYNVWLIDVYKNRFIYRENGVEYDVDLNDFSIKKGDQRIKLDYAYVMIHGTPGEDGHIQGYLEMMGIPFSSCDMVSSVITFDKVTTKRTVADAGIPLAKEILLRRGDVVDSEQIVSQLGLPLFVKPNASGSSYGVTKVKSVDELPAAVAAAFEESSEVLVEEFIAGREVACGILVTSEKELLLPITEIIAKNEFFDYEAKYTAGMSDEITPADLDDELVERLNQLTLAAYKACRCRGLVRVDFIVTPEGVPYMIELNSIPGMSAGSIVPKQIAAAGMTIKEVLSMVIEDSLCNQ
ncbi:MAG: D-alanine--D-alanine ligase [Tidjanibacter sp.]|nr:D-alanine--D-alanine ligase [Tidjanibacter sp.]